MLRVSLDTLPGQRSAHHAHQDIRQTFEVVAPRSLHADMATYGSVSRCSGEPLPALTVWHVLLGLLVKVGLRQAEIDDVDLRAVATSTEKEVVRLHISVQNPLLVHILQPLNHLICTEKRGGGRERMATAPKVILQGWSEKFQGHGIVAPSLAIPKGLRDSHAASEARVERPLVRQEGLLAGAVFQFYCNLLASLSLAEVHLAKGTSADTPSELVGTGLARQ
mmetsp:Transcript_20846/g.45945  ORF Transcript_20846/g.45945 Transcript_20846/m.45945 type:complete len:222 (+) Transcript_20846:600-1265(+)